MSLAFPTRLGNELRFHRPPRTAPAKVLGGRFATSSTARAAADFGPIVPEAAFALRPYQEQCVHSCLSAIDSGLNRIGVLLPTGSGKTTIFCTLINRMQPTTSGASRALILVGSIELARQAATQVELLYPGLSVEIEQGPRYRASGMADVWVGFFFHLFTFILRDPPVVIVTPYQTLNQANRLRKFDPRLYKVVVVDEAHHSAAPSYLRILSRFNGAVNYQGISGPIETPSSASASVPIVGFSTTFSRPDRQTLGKVFHHIVYHKEFPEMMKENWLCPMVLTVVRARMDLSDVTINSATSDFAPSSLAKIIDTDAINQLVLGTWLDRASILTEGVDVPNIDCAVVARPTRSKNLFAQIIGRGMRLFPKTGKKDCRIINLVDSLERVGNIVNAPILLGLKPDEVIDDEDGANEGAGGRPLKEKASVSPPKSMTYFDYDNPFSLATDASGSPLLSRMSPFAWVKCGLNGWVLDCLRQGYPEKVRFIATFIATVDRDQRVMGVSRSLFVRKQNMLTADTLDAAIRGCDTYITIKVVFGHLALG
ncbi:hypothetical protein FRB96_006034 [Tulasnella sp. 330]|nr:hypothetical protein FRB96_006034 [Tulasnella sp. 330]